jgi:CHASE2 domain-containing sensor protein
MHRAVLVFHCLKVWISHKGLAYWITAAVILALATWSAPFIERFTNLTAAQNWLFQHLTQSVTNPSHARHVKLVLIRDEDFWNGPLHHRTPIDRSFLGRVVRALDTADASVIALDIDMRLADPYAKVRPGDYAKVDSYQLYRDETDALVRAVGDAATRRKIVLSKTLGGTERDGFTFEADTYEAYGICSGLNSDGTWRNPGTPEYPLTPAAQRNISCGYIALMDDRRRIPLPIAIVGQSGKMDSFPLAVARARDPGITADLRAHEYYGTYINDDVIADKRVTVFTHELLRNPESATPVLQGWPVIVGEAWSTRGLHRGAQVDVHDTPIGTVNGALIHENVAEAVLSNRIYPGISNTALKALEIVVGAAAAVLFAAFATVGKRLAMLAATMAALLAAQWVTLQLFGAFFDAYIPVFALGLHAVVAGLTESHPAEAAST